MIGCLNSNLHEFDSTGSRCAVCGQHMDALVASVRREMEEKKDIIEIIRKREGW